MAQQLIETIDEQMRTANAVLVECMKLHEESELIRKEHAAVITAERDMEALRKELTDNVWRVQDTRKNRAGMVEVRNFTVSRYSWQQQLRLLPACVRFSCVG